MSRYLFGAAVLFAAGFVSAAEKELHVVALYEGHDGPRDRSRPGTAVVTVDRPGKEVVLVVSGYEPILWDVRATPKTTIKKVLAVGYYHQGAVAPKGVEIEELTYDRKNHTHIYVEYSIETQQLRPFVQKLAGYTSLEVLSFQGDYRFNPKKPFVVDTIQKDERLSSEFPKLTPAAQVPKFKLEGTRYVTKPDKSQMHLFGEFTQSGPSADGMPQLPKRITQLAYDPTAKEYYGTTGHEFHLVDLKAGTSAKLLPPAGIELNWLRALTCDSKRDRIVISGRGALYEFSTKTGKWAMLGGRPKGHFEGLVWQKSTDTLYAVGEERVEDDKPKPTLYELNAAGAIVKTTPLASPLFPGVMAHNDGRVQLVDVGDNLALLIHTSPRDSHSGAPGKRETFLYVIDPKTGKVKLAWKE